MEFNEAIGSGDLKAPYLAQLHQAEHILDTLLYNVYFTHARLPDDKPLPYGHVDRRGYWGDMFKTASFGSLLWLVPTMPNTRETWDFAQQTATEAVRRWIKPTIATGFVIEAGKLSVDDMYLHTMATLPNGKPYENVREIRTNAL